LITIGQKVNEYKNNEKQKFEDDETPVFGDRERPTH